MIVTHSATHSLQIVDVQLEQTSRATFFFCFIIQVAHIPLEHLLIPPMQFPQEVFFFFQRIFLEALALPLDNLFDEYKCTIVCFLCCCRDLWASLSGGKRPR